MPVLRGSRLFPAILLGVLALAGSRASAQNVEWKPFEKGLKDAAAAKKYSFVDVYTDWCGYCKQLEQTTLKAKPVVSELGKNFVSIRFNAESDEKVTWKGKTVTMAELSAMWGVEGFPTLLFLNPKGDIIGSFASFADENLMINLLKYISSGARERKVSFEDFLKEAT